MVRNMNPILEQLKRETLYAKRSLSTELLYQTYGKAQMAWKSIFSINIHTFLNSH